MKQLFKKNKYLLPSATIFVATVIMLGFDSQNITDFLSKLGDTLLYGTSTAFGIFILSTVSGWLLFPFAPKYEDFATDEEREKHFSLGSRDLLLFIFLVISATLVFSGYIK